MVRSRFSVFLACTVALFASLVSTVAEAVTRVFAEAFPVEPRNPLRTALPDPARQIGQAQVISYRERRLARQPTRSGPWLDPAVLAA